MITHNGISRPSMRTMSACMTNDADVAKTRTGALHQRSDQASNASPTTSTQRWTSATPNTWSQPNRSPTALLVRDEQRVADLAIALEQQTVDERRLRLAEVGQRVVVDDPADVDRQHTRSADQQEDTERDVGDRGTRSPSVSTRTARRNRRRPASALTCRGRRDPDWPSPASGPSTTVTTRQRVNDGSGTSSARAVRPPRHAPFPAVRRRGPVSPGTTRTSRPVRRRTGSRLPIRGCRSRLTSRTLRGVPSGFEVSNRSSASG